MKPLKIAVLMDDISNINPKKDSSLAMLLEADRRGWKTYTFDTFDMFFKENQIFANAAVTKVSKSLTNWYTKEANNIINLATIDFIVMRKDPPFNMDYIYSTYLLEQLENKGVLVVNKAASLRDANEKLFSINFPNLIPETLISASKKQIKDFIKKQQLIVVKPLDGMGGVDIFKIKSGDVNIDTILNYLTNNETRQIISQKFLTAIEKGDKRILIINGEPINYALVRMPAKHNFKGNLAAGATGIVKPINTRDKYLCQQIAPLLKNKGLLFVGLDVIGDYITEINVTSPTCIKEIDQELNINIAGKLFDMILHKINL